MKDTKIRPSMQQDRPSITGRVFGRLRVIADDYGQDDDGKTTVLVRCHEDCDHEVTKEVRRTLLITGRIKSCGACRHRNPKGQRRTPTT